LVDAITFCAEISKNAGDIHGTGIVAVAQQQGQDPSDFGCQRVPVKEPLIVLRAAITAAYI
jgi:hypothetical protein